MIKILKITSMSEKLDSLLKLHYACREIMDARNYQAMVDKINEVIEKGDVNEMKTVLILLQGGIREHPILKPHIEKLSQRFNDKIEAYRNEKQKL